MTDNLPERREEETPSERISYYNSSFYQRENVDTDPVVAGRRIKPSRQCKICRLVPNLIEQGYTFYEATDAEQDFYRFVYTFWSADDMARWLKRTHNYDVAHDSVNRHIHKHIPDPNVAMLERVKSYKPEFMNKKFFSQLADTMKLAGMKYQAGVSTGAIQITTADFIAISKTLKDWQGFLSDLQEDKTDEFMEAVALAIEKTLAPHPELRDQFTNTFREELEKIENRNENMEDEGV